MADNLENKSEKKKEIKQDEKIAKTSSSNKSNIVTTSPRKADEKSDADNKAIREAPQSGLENKKVKSTKKMLNLIKSWMNLKMTRNQSFLKKLIVLKM